MVHCFLCRCIVPVIIVVHLVVGGGDRADADGGSGGGGDGGNPCNCDFQNDMCCWKGLPLSTRAVWERPNGTVGHHESMTGQILKDHTYQNDTKCYVHVSARNEIAILQSYALKMSTIYCLRFWYYIEVGPGKGNLHVILVNYTTGDIKGAEAQSAWTAPFRTPTNTYWIGAQVEIYYKDLFRIFFLASYVDYTAIDDITLIEAPCEVRPTEKPSLTVGTISVSKSSASHVSPSISTNKPEASQRNGITDVLAVRPTEKPNLTLGTVSVSKSSTSHVSTSISTNTLEASQRNGRTEFLAVRPTEKPSLTVGTISVSKSSASHVSPSISTNKPEASQRNGITDVLAVKRPPENLSSTEKPNLTQGTVSVSKSSTSHVSPSISTNKTEASQRNGITDVLAVRPTEKPSLTVGTISVSKSSASHVPPSISTNKPEASQRNGITDVLAVKRPPENLSSTEKPNLTQGTVSVSKSSTSHVSPSISTNKTEASQRNGITDVLAVRPTEKPSLTVGTISVSKSSASHVSPSISTNKPEASQRNGITDVLAEKPSVVISSGSFGSPFVSTPTFEASQRTGNTDVLAVANLIQASNRAETTISISELNSTDGQLYVTSRKSVSFKTPTYTVSKTEIFYICIGVGCFLLLACCIGTFLFWKHLKRSQNRNDIEHNTPKSVPFPTSPYAAEPIKQNGDKHYGFSTTLYTIEQEIAVSRETGNGVQMLSESAKEIYQGKDFQGKQRDETVLTERTIGADKMSSKSLFTKSKQSCNSSVAHGSKGKKMQIKAFETGLESNTGQTVLPSTSKGRKQTKPNSRTSCAVERNEINISNKRDEVSNTCTGRNDNENLLKTLNPPQNESSRNNVTYDSKAILGTQQRNAHGQPFNYMVMSADKAHDSSNSANKMRVKFTSDHIF